MTTHHHQSQEQVCSSATVDIKTIERLNRKISQLEAENFQLKNLIDNLPGDIYWKNNEGIWLGVNKMGAQSLQQIGFIHDRTDVIGKSDYQLFSKETADGYRQNDIEVITKKIELTREETNHLPNGEKITQLSKKRPLWDQQGNVVGVVGNTIDISYLKKIEDELKDAKEKAEIASQAKTEFLENMRHDIRTPLTGIVGFSDILKMESDNPQIKDYADNLVASSHALLDLLDDVLEAIRVSSGEIPKLKKKFNLEKTLQHVVNLNQAKAAQKRLSLTLQFDATIPTYVVGDKVRIHRIALELIANALNFTDTGFVNVSVVLAKRHQRELIIKLVVNDSGIGIPKDKQQDIYLQFKRLTPSYQGIYKGTGLGLSVVKQFIDELDGEIYVENGLTNGSTFTCVIPLHESLLDDDLGLDEQRDNAIDAPYETTFAQGIRPLSSYEKQHDHRVLIVEDSRIAQTVARSILAQLHCASDIADHGRQAIELWKKHHYDLILMDIGLPDLDGYDVTHQIRVQELAKKSHVPIIALTAHVGDENKKRCIEAGMNAVLTKPLTLKHCADMVDAFIPGRQRQESNIDSTLAAGALPTDDQALFQLASFPSLDINEGIKTMGSETTLRDMLTLMIQESLPNDLRLLQEAHEAHDWHKTQQLAHKIKGGAVYVGTIRLKMACQFLERYWKTGQHALLEKLYQQVVNTIEDSLRDIVLWLTHH